MPTAKPPCVGRWVALAAGLPIEVPGLQLDRRCGGGLQTIATAAMMIESGACDVVLAGGVESMSRIEYYTTDLLFPDLHAHHLNALLDEQKLKADREGLRRSAYSLRHTYICLRLMEGAAIYQIAKNCRTSVEMIEKFYAAHIKNMVDASAVNVRRVAANAAPSKRKANAKRSRPAPSGGHPKRRP